MPLLLGTEPLVEYDPSSPLDTRPGGPYGIGGNCDGHIMGGGGWGGGKG